MLANNYLFTHPADTEQHVNFCIYLFFQSFSVVSTPSSRESIVMLFHCFLQDSATNIRFVARFPVGFYIETRASFPLSWRGTCLPPFSKSSLCPTVFYFFQTDSHPEVSLTILLSLPSDQMQVQMKWWKCWWIHRSFFYHLSLKAISLMSSSEFFLIFFMPFAFQAPTGCLTSRLVLWTELKGNWQLRFSVLK